MSYRTIEIDVDAQQLSIVNTCRGPLLVYPTTTRIRATIFDEDGAVDLTGKDVSIIGRDPAALNVASDLFDIAATTDADWTDLTSGKISFLVDTDTADMATFLGAKERADIHLAIHQTTDGIPFATVPQQQVRQTAT